MEQPTDRLSDMKASAGGGAPRLWTPLAKVWVCLFLLTLTSSAAAQGLYEITAAPVFGNVYPPGRWIPIRIELRNASDQQVDGMVVISAAGNVADFGVPARVPAESRVDLTSYAFFPNRPVDDADGTGVVPVAVAEWRGADASRLARASILARPDTADASDDGSVVLPGRLLLYVRAAGESGGLTRTAELSSLIGDVRQAPLTVTEVDAAGLPGHRAGYDAVLAVVFDAARPDDLDAAQRQALMDYLLAGGAVVFAAPPADAGISASWIAQHLPVHLIGSRESDQLQFAAEGDTQTATPKLRGSRTLCEAIDAGAEVVLGERHYVHAAVRRVGLGRVIFTSFPVDAFESTDEAASALWKRLLGADSLAPGWEETELSAQRDTLLEAMIGTPTASWSFAAGVAGAYAVACLLLHFIWRGGARPRAFAYGSGLAVVTTAGLIAMITTRDRGEQGITAARLATVQLGPQGGGVHHESFVFLGRDEPDFSLAASRSSTLRPVVAGLDDPPLVQQTPFSVPQAGVRSGRVDRIWQSTSVVDRDTAVRAAVRFTADGVQLEVDNQTGTHISTPLFVWNGRAFQLPDLANGTSRASLPAANVRGDFTNAAVFTGEDANIRGRIVRAAVSSRKDRTPPSRSSPMLLGWIESIDAEIGKSNVRPDAEPSSWNSRVLLAAPVSTIPSAAGEKVKIPPELVRTKLPGEGGAPFDSASGEWVPSSLVGTWRIGFQLPQGIGEIGKVDGVVIAQLSAPSHTVRLQAAGADSAATTIAEWTQVVGRRSVPLRLDAGDVDPQGCIWLDITVQSAADGVSGMQPPWEINELFLDCSVTIAEPR